MSTFQSTNIAPIFSKNAGTFIDCISIEFCTEEPRYLQNDSHFIQIPVRLFNSMISNGEPLYIGIQNSITHKRLYFGRVEPSIRSPNSTIDMCIMPNWVLEKLGLELIGGKVDIVKMIPNVNINKLGFIKIRGEKSGYVNWSDIKERLEDKISQFNCLNLGDHFIIDDIKFIVTELRDKNNNLCDYGSTFNTDVKLEFEVPDDLVEKERKEKERIERIEKERKERIEKERNERERIEKVNKSNKSNKNQRENRHGMKLMTFNDIKDNDENDKNDTKESKEEKHEYFSGPGLKVGKIGNYSDLNNSNVSEQDKRLIQKKIREERAKLLEDKIRKEEK